MTYSVGNLTVANYANTSTGKVTNVVADNGLGGSGVAVDRITLNFVIASSMQFVTVDVTSLNGYIAGNTDVTITVNENVYVYGYPPNQVFPSAYLSLFTNILDASMQIIGGSAGDTITLVNNGNIVGYGGDGGAVSSFITNCSSLSVDSVTPSKGNAALSFITPGISLTIENNGYIAGGGGGGGGTGANSYNFVIPGGGGGAGGGISGIIGGGGNSTSRAVPPNAGVNGQLFGQYYGCCCCVRYALYGGGGGFVLPGTGGVSASTGTISEGIGGGAGGSGSSSSAGMTSYNNNGGSGSNPAPSYNIEANSAQGGGGGGWGAAGAAGYYGTYILQTGAAGGNSIVTNGNAFTLTGAGTIYGTADTTLRSAVFTFPTTSYSGTAFDITTTPGYTTGTNVVLIVPASVILSSTSNATAGLTISKSGTSNDPASVRIIVNGNILGAGGKGGDEANSPTVGGTALLISTSNITYNIENATTDSTKGYIAGGGGGGGRSNTAGPTSYIYGGGGAGYGGSSGSLGATAYNQGITSGVSAGNNGTTVISGILYASGGSGGTILPGVRRDNPPSIGPNITYTGLGGEAGGSGAYVVNISGPLAPTNFGGAYKQSGGTQTSASIIIAGGGGGWGSSGGRGRRQFTSVQEGAAAGRSVQQPSSSNSVFILNQIKLAGLLGA